MIVSKLFAVMAFAMAVSPAVAQPSLEDLQWMAGDRVHAGATSTREVWSGPDAGALSGVGVTSGPDGRALATEQMRITTLPDGRLAFIANPSGQAETAFPLKSYGGRRAVFENLNHDFPQRVIYWDKGGGVVGARIEGVVSGHERAMEWTFAPR